MEDPVRAPPGARATGEVFGLHRDLIHPRATRPDPVANASASGLHVNDGAKVPVRERFFPEEGPCIVVASFSNADLGEDYVGVPRSGNRGVAHAQSILSPSVFRFIASSPVTMTMSSERTPPTPRR